MPSWIPYTVLFGPGTLIFLTQGLISLFIAVKLLNNPRKSQTTWMIAIGFSVLTSFWLSSFVLDATLWAPANIVQGICLAFVSTVFIQIAYHIPYPSPDQRRESKFILGLSTLWAVSIAIWNAANPAHATTTLRIIFFIKIALELLWSYTVLLRRMIAQYIRWRASLTDEQQAPPQGHGVQRLWHALHDPSDQPAHITRAFLRINTVLFLISLWIGWFQSIAIPQSFLVNVLFGLTVHLGLTVFQFIFALTYLNTMPEQSSFMTKLTLTVLVLVLSGIGLVGQSTVVMERASYEAVYREAIQHVEAALAALDDESGAHTDAPLVFNAEAIPETVTLILSQPITPTNPGPSTYSLHVERAPRPFDLAALHRAGLWCHLFICKIDSPGASDRYYVNHDLSPVHQGRRYTVGLSYDLYHTQINAQALPFIAALLGFSALTLLTLPAFFRNSLINPLNNLLQGVREVNAGNLDTTIPLLYNDELGFLTRSFNAMITSLKEERATLESRVAQRTAELSTANAAMAEEIVQRERVENALRESEVKYRGVAEQANDGIIIAQDNRIVYCNPQFAAILGYDIEKLEGSEFVAFLAPDQKARVQGLYQQRLQGNPVPTRYETVVVHRDGHRIEVEINAGQMTYAGRPASLAIVRDVTERKQFEHYLRESEQRYRQLNEDLERRVAQLSTLNSIARTVANITDLEEVLNVVVRQIMQLFDACGATIGLLNDARTAQTLVAAHTTQAALQDSLGTRRPLDEDAPARQVLESGHAFIVADAQQNPVTKANRILAERYGIRSLMTVPLFTRGESIGTFTLITDQAGRSFTAEEARLAETVAGQIAGVINNAHLFERMREARVAAEAANRAKSIFIANMSHELRTPLNAILGFSQLMVHAPNITPEQQQNLTIIHHSGEELLTLINKILNLADAEVTSQDLDAALALKLDEPPTPARPMAHPAPAHDPEISLSESQAAAIIKAAVEGDINHIHQLITDLRADHPDLAQRLKVLADRFDYDSIHHLITGRDSM